MHPNRHAIAYGSLLFMCLLIIAFIASLFWLWPKYKVYKKEMDGIASLKEAEWSKQILIEEAKAREQAALMQAKAEDLADIERAKAAAEANRIIGESLKGNDEYLRYIWIKGLQDGHGERIYIPTEAGLPILEAGKAGK